MDKLLFRLITIGENLYISFYDVSTIGNSRNFEIDIPERTGFHLFTNDEYMLFSSFDLIPDIMDTALGIGEFDNPVLAVGDYKHWTTSYIKEKDGKWIGHQPFKFLGFYRTLIYALVGMIDVFVAFWIAKLFNIL